jgi:DNA-binding NtrC family response regulator
MAAFYVLVVDDEQPIRTLLRRRLESWGYPVKEADNAEAALEQMVSEPAAIAIIDIRMPGHNGLWLAEQIQHQFPTSATVLATADPDIATADRLRRGIIG